MKISKTISIDSDLLSKIEIVSKESNISLSDIITKLIIGGFKLGEPVNVKCPMCSTIYLNKEGFCPKCKKELEEREQALLKETSIINLKTRLEKLIEWKAKGLFVTDNEINNIKEKIDKLERGL